MENYVRQLLSDIEAAKENVIRPVVPEEGWSISDWISPEEEDATARVRQLDEWTGITKDQLPPDEMLNDDQVHCLFEALKNMLDEFNWMWVTQFQIPERLQYRAIRDYFDQPAKEKHWHMGFFEHCRPGTEHKKCALGEYCHCAFFVELFSGFEDEDLSPEEERARELEMEINHLKKRYGDRWMKYYPYHLDKNYDDESGNPYNYGFGDEEDDDNWWKK